MKMRTSLALLSVATAAAACHVYVGDQPPAAPSSTPAPAPAASAAPQPVTPSRVVALHVGGPAGGTPSSAPASAAPGTAAPTAATPACLDNGSSPVASCDALPASEPACPSQSTARARCLAAKQYFVPKVAASAVSCELALTSQQRCDATQVSGCATAPLAQACPDASVAQLCQIAASPCGTPAGTCASILSGLNDSGKQAIAQCVAQGCAGGLAGCINALGAPAASSLRVR